MGALSLDELSRSLEKGAFDPAYYLYGDEDVLKDEAIRALADAALDPATRDFNLDQRAAGELDLETLNALVNTPPMLASRRLVVVRGVGELRRRPKAREWLARYLDAPNPSTVLVLVQAAGEAAEADLAGRATAVEAERLAPERAARWVARRAGELGLQLEAEAVELLLVAAGTGTGGAELSVLARELEKLAGLAAGRPATGADVAALVGVRHGETVHDLVDAVLERRTVAAARLVEPVLEQAGVTGVRVVSALGTALVGTALAGAELDAGVPRSRLPDVVFRHLVAARPFGLRPWKEESGRWARWAEHWSGAELARALRLALEADRALKSSTVSDDRGILTGLVLAIAVPAREAA